MYSLTKKEDSPVAVRVLVSQSTVVSLTRMQLDATLIVNPHCLSLLCLVDSGADENFLDLNLVTQAGIGVEQLLALLDANDLKFL